MGSVRELKARLSASAYGKIKPHVKGRDWQIVAWDHNKLVIRVDRENLLFDVGSGKLRDRVILGKPRKN